MNELVSKHEVVDSVLILTAIEIVAIATKVLTKTVVVVEHRGYTVKAEAVELIFLQPELTVRE